MKLRRWPISGAGATGAGAGMVLALWSMPEQIAPFLGDLRICGTVAACTGATLAATIIRNRYLR